MASAELSVQLMLRIWLAETSLGVLHDSQRGSGHVAHEREEFRVRLRDEQAVDHMHVDFIGEIEHSGRLPGFLEREEVLEVVVKVAVFGGVGEGGTEGADMLRKEVVVDGWTRFEGFNGGDVGAIGCERFQWETGPVEEELDC